MLYIFGREFFELNPVINSTIRESLTESNGIYRAVSGFTVSEATSLGDQLRAAVERVDQAVREGVNSEQIIQACASETDLEDLADKSYINNITTLAGKLFTEVLKSCLLGHQSDW